MLFPSPTKKIEKKNLFPSQRSKLFPSPTTKKKVKKTFPLPNDTTLFSSPKCTRPINSRSLLYCIRPRIATRRCFQPEFHYAVFRPGRRPKKTPRNRLHYRSVLWSSTSFRALYSMVTPHGVLFSAFPSLELL